MRAKIFFKNCKEMVDLRWIAQFANDGHILMRRLWESYWEIDNPFSPISAVAVDIYGARIKFPHNIWESAAALELSKDFTVLVFQASCVDRSEEPVIQEIRQELVTAISPVAYPGVDIRGLFG